MQAGPPPTVTSAPTYAQVATALAGAANATTTVGGAMTIQKSGHGTTRTTGLLLENTSTTGTQDSPDLEFIAHQGATVPGGVKKFRIGVRPSAGGISLFMDKDDGTGSYSEGGALSYQSLDSSLFDNRTRSAGGFMAVTLGYQFTDGAGLVRSYGGDIRVTHLATTTPLTLQSARSAANSGSAFRLQGTAGPYTNGYHLDVGDTVSSSFVARWGVWYTGRIDWFQTAAVSALGQLGMDFTTGRILTWCSSSGATAASQAVAVQADVKFTHQSIAGDVSITGVGVFGEVDTSAARNITLPAIPSGVSDRTVDIWIVDGTGSAGANNITLTTSGSNTIKGGSSATIATNYGARGLKHNGQTGASGKWFIVADA